MITSRLSLDGDWEFRHSYVGPAEESGAPRIVSVPGPWQGQFADLRTRSGTAWYRREIEIPKGWVKGRVFLTFGAVFHLATVRVNGLTVCQNEGGFLPFSADVTDLLRDGEPNEVRVKVESPSDDLQQHPETPLGEIPFGKQSWYGPLSGIWQSVYLERRDADHIERVRVVSNLQTGDVRLDVVLSRPVEGRIEVEATIYDPAGTVVSGWVDTPLGGERNFLASGKVSEVRPWSPDSPNLYRLVLALNRDGAIVHQLVESFGFRDFETRYGRFFLNGEHIYLRAALDQDYYPEGICTPPSLAFLEDQFRKAKELGLNAVRCHIKVPDPRYYEAADRVGLLVWTELPNTGTMTERGRARAEALLKGIVDRDGNHPSIVIWTIINENWGTDLVHNADDREWLKRTYAWLKQYDPGRLVVDNSPLAPSMHVQTDIADFHYYAAIPDNRHAWDRFVDELSTRPAWLFGDNEQTVVTGKEAVMCSEFGNWGLPHPEEIADADGAEPWWFETGHDWGDGIMYPHGIQNRFHDWSLDRVFGSFSAFIDAAQWQQFRALKYEIESMRRKPALAGYVITELTDCHWESNGLLDMRRNPRVFHWVFGAINAETVIIAKSERSSYWAGERIRIELVVAHGSGTPFVGGTLVGSTGWSQSVPVPPIEAGSVVELGTIEVEAPKPGHSQIHRIVFDLIGAQGQIVATNAIECAVHPNRPSKHSIRLFAPEDHIASHLGAVGYRMVRNPDSADLTVTSETNESLAEYVRKGGRLLLLTSESSSSLHPFFPHWQDVKVRPREGSLWAGDWASSFAWLRREGSFQDLPGGPLLDQTFDRVLPTHVIAGCNLIDFQARVHAGLVVGWVHKAAALTVERGYGTGRLVASTFRLFRDAPKVDPTATRLVDGLIQLAIKGKRQPVTSELDLVSHQ